MYYFAEARRRPPGSTASFIAPRFKEEDRNIDKCLEFQFNAYGEHIGELHLLDEKGNTLWVYRPRESAVLFYINTPFCCLYIHVHVHP